jgi:ADP-dependent phosphofructokinase/glucokinase
VLLYLSLPTTKVYSGVHRLEENMKEHTYNTYVVKSNNGFKKRVKSYNQIKMHMYMDVWGIYMVANLILLCSLKTYLFF